MCKQRKQARSSLLARSWNFLPLVDVRCQLELQANFGQRVKYKYLAKIHNILRCPTNSPETTSDAPAFPEDKSTKLQTRCPPHLLPHLIPPYFSSQHENKIPHNGNIISQPICPPRQNATPVPLAATAQCAFECQNHCNPTQKHQHRPVDARARLQGRQEDDVQLSGPNGWRNIGAGEDKRYSGGGGKAFARVE